jgi:hypothetical protein
MKVKRYIVGTRDTNGLYRAVGVDARTITDAKIVAVNRSEALGVQVIAVSCRQR